MIFFFNKWCYENKFAVCLEVNCFKYSPIFMREKLIFFLLPRVFSQELRLVQYKRSTCNKLWSDFWMVLCRAKSWTQWSLWVPSNSDYSVILWNCLKIEASTFCFYSVLIMMYFLMVVVWCSEEHVPCRNWGCCWVQQDQSQKAAIHKAQLITIITGSFLLFAKHLKGQLCKSKAWLLLFIPALLSLFHTTDFVSFISQILHYLLKNKIQGLISEEQSLCS